MSCRFPKEVGALIGRPMRSQYQDLSGYAGVVNGSQFTIYAVDYTHGTLNWAPYRPLSPYPLDFIGKLHPL